MKNELKNETEYLKTLVAAEHSSRQKTKSSDGLEKILIVQKLLFISLQAMTGKSVAELHGLLDTSVMTILNWSENI